MNVTSLAELVTEIDQVKAEVDRLRPIPAEREQLLREKVRLEWNYHSNAIEGNRLTLGETRALLHNRATASDRTYDEHRDIRGHDRAINLIYDMIARREELTEAAIREIHKVLLVEEYEVEAITPNRQKTLKLVVPGQYKHEPNCVFVGGTPRMYALPEETPARMREMLEWYRKEEKSRENHILFTAAIFHHTFTHIHPFDDGNGRMARLLLNFILMRHGFPPVILSVNDRERYVEALRAADNSSAEIGQLVQFVGESLLAALDLDRRGARGEKIEEITDLDKEMLLLRRQLEKRPEPVPLSDEAILKCFEHSVLPLIGRLISKLSEFDDYFSSCYVHVTGSRFHETPRPHGSKALQLTGFQEKMSKEDLLKSIRRLPPERVRSLDIQFAWNGFKKGDLNVFDYHESIACRFEPLKFRVSVGAHHSSNPPTIERWYQHELGEDAIRDLVDAARKQFIKRIKQAVNV